MQIGLSQSLRPELSLRLSPQILQRIEVLQLHSLDLRQMVEQELEQNETLERADEVDDAEPEPEPTDEDSAYDDLYPDDADNWTKPSPDAVSSQDVLEATAQARVTLADHLIEQLALVDLDERMAVIVAAVVEAIDDRGWLSEDLDELSINIEPPASAEERDRALEVVQSLDPRGVGARDVTECLALQLDEDDPDFSLLSALVQDHIDDIAHNRIPKITRATGADTPSVLAAIETIRHLDPIPGRSFGGDEVPHVRPDVVVRKVGDGFEIALENDWIPDLTVSRSYLDMVSNRQVDPALRKHIRGKIEGARSLIDAIEQRKNTLSRVTNELVTRQAEFFERGKSALHPLKMQDIADVLGVHVSTVSRAINGKFIQTDRGIVAMRDLFTGEVTGSDGSDGASRAGTEEVVRKIIAGEDKTKPLSDEAIVAILKDDHGLEVARRTVTKYRKKLGLGSSRDRRDYSV